MRIIEEAIKSIDGKDYDCKGNFKKCYFVNIEGKEYALLVYKCDEERKEINNLRINETKKLIEQGFLTAPILDLLYDNGNAYELQERVKGNIICGKYIPLENSEDYDSFYLSVLDSLKIIERSSNDKLIDLMNNAALVYSNSYPLDSHGDNYIIDSEGNITFIDIDISTPAKKRDIKIHYCLSVLPNILSTFTYYVREDSKYYKALKELLASISIKWVDACNTILNYNGYSEEDIKELINGIRYNYFLQSEEEKNEMLNNYFGSNKSM